MIHKIETCYEESANMDKQVQTLLNTKGLSWVLTEVSKWVTNKEEHLRAYQPEEREDIDSFKKIHALLSNAIEAYK